MKKIGIGILITILLLFSVGWITHYENAWLDDSIVSNCTIDNSPIGSTTPASVTGTTVTGTSLTDGTLSFTSGIGTGLVSMTYSENSNLAPDTTNGSTLGAETTGFTSTNYIGAVNQTVYTFDDYTFDIIDSEGSGGHGYVKLIDFPEGMIYAIGVIGDISVDTVSSIGATGTFDMGLGADTTGTDNEALSGAEQDFVAKVDGTLVDGADTIDLVNNTPQTEDGHSASTDVYLNIAVTDTDMSGDGHMKLTGTILITWINTGDY